MTSGMAYVVFGAAANPDSLAAAIRPCECLAVRYRRVLSRALCLLSLVLSACVFSAEPPVIRAGSELDFRPYCFTDATGRPTGLGPELLDAVAERMGLQVQRTTGSWDKMWNDLVAGNLDVLPVVARTPGREPLVDFSLPHTETFDAFFVREGRPPLKDLAAATGKEVVVLRSDAAHHQLLERKFAGKIISVGSISDGLRLIAAGQHDAFLCSKMIGVLECERAGIVGVKAGPPISDYKRAFAFGVRKGNAELVEKLNQGLRIVKADGTYDRIYRKWLGLERPPVKWWERGFWRAVGMLGVLALVGVTWAVARKALALEFPRSQTELTPPRVLAAAFWRYALAVVTVALSLSAHIGLEAWVGGRLPFFVLFYPAVMIAALLGGIGPGVLAIALSVAVVKVWILPRVGDLSISSQGDRVAVALFCCVNLFLAAVAELYRRNRAKAAMVDRAEALRESEARLRLFIEHAPASIAMFDRDMRYLAVSNRWMAEYLPGRKQIIGQSHYALFPDCPERWRAAHRCGLAGEVVRQEEDSWVLPDGRTLWARYEVRPWHAADGVVGGIVIFTEDITERKAFQTELQRLVDERTAKLQDLVGELEHFSYTITHDLKAPLRAMRGFAEIMEATWDSCDREQAKSFLRRISTSAERMDLLIRDALNYSRAVRQELALENVDAEALLRGILDTYPEFQVSKARIVVEGKLPVVLANEAGLTQCFSNLLGNAVKFVQPGEMPNVRIRVTHRDGWVRFWVEDQGIGISKEMLPRVFDMFSRGDKRYEGTGIGLALVRKVAHGMGGKVGVESEEGRGSRFWIELKCGETDPAWVGASDPPELAAVQPARQEIVLYVEDEEGDAILMERAFRKQGLAGRLRLVGDGRAAIGYLSGSGEYGDRGKFPLPSLVLLDLNLPQLSGFEVLRWMRKHPDFARIPVVIFSSSTREDDRAKAKELGANEFVAKPSSGLKFGEVAQRLQERWLGTKR